MCVFFPEKIYAASEVSFLLAKSSSEIKMGIS